MKRLTDTLVRNLEPREREYAVREGGGFLVRVQPTGARSFEFVYDFRGRRRRLTLGAYDPKAYPLAQARRDYKAAVALLARGVDPAAHRAEEKTRTLEEAATTVEGTVKLYLDQHVDRNLKAKTAREYRYALTPLLSRYAKRPLVSVTRRHVLALTEDHAQAGKAAQAALTHRILAGFFNWCVERAHLPVSPMQGLRPPAKVESRDRVLSDDELRAVWIAAGRLAYPWHPLLWMLALTGQRLGEVAGMRWTDLDGAIWTIPDSKRGTPHAITLPPLALAVLDTVPRYGVYVFSVSAGERPVTVGSKLKAEPDPKRVRTKGGKAPRGHKPGLLDVALAQLHAEDPERYPPPTPWRLHDLRRTVASGMARLGIAPHVIEAVLNHRSGRVSGIARVYNRYDHAAEIGHALAAWAAHVEGLLREKPASNVLPMRAAG